MAIVWTCAGSNYFNKGFLSIFSVLGPPHLTRYKAGWSMILPSLILAIYWIFKMCVGFSKLLAYLCWSLLFVWELLRCLFPPLLGPVAHMIVLLTVLRVSFALFSSFHPLFLLSFRWNVFYWPVISLPILSSALLNPSSKFLNSDVVLLMLNCSFGSVFIQSNMCFVFLHPLFCPSFSLFLWAH